ncbi:hypothetical protein J9317_05660 [Metabacillus sp. KIGAM252]|uniref:TPM domain-containing protein n=1 Tax=Metabacillus flavus TaxID=2823519 RepID=A0ABS5LBZ3_9BACI|nr:hypothetical protein [Metabacillus flavus]MBS2968242.1 hypothetical protein [Metabacillus flavus]
MEVRAVDFNRRILKDWGNRHMAWIGLAIIAGITFIIYKAIKGTKNHQGNRNSSSSGFTPFFYSGDSGDSSSDGGGFDCGGGGDGGGGGGGD